MSHRILIVSNHLSKERSNTPPAYLKDPISFLRLEDFIPIALNMKRKSLRQFLIRDIQPNIPDHYEEVDFPLSILPKLKHLFGIPESKYGCRKIDIMESYINVYEASRVDASLGAFIGVEGTIVYAVYLLGSEEQKKELLPQLTDLKISASWAYSEPETGSYSTSLQTSAEPTETGFILNGTKRWVGNSNFSHILVWARNTSTSKIEAFFLPANTKNVRLEVIKGKFNSRLTQNGIVYFENVVVSEKSRLFYSDNEESVKKLFEISRTGLAFAPTGLIGGVFEHLITYLNNKVRYGTPLTSHQMIQEKLVRILAIYSNSFLLAWRLIQLQENGQVDVASTSLIKTIVTSAGKDVVRIAREMMGSNGISLDNFVMKALVDMESYYNLESTYNVCVLVAGRDITGISSFSSK